MKSFVGAAVAALLTVSSSAHAENFRQGVTYTYGVGSYIYDNPGGFRALSDTMRVMVCHTSEHSLTIVRYLSGGYQSYGVPFTTRVGDIFPVFNRDGSIDRMMKMVSFNQKDCSGSFQVL